MGNYDIKLFVHGVPNGQDIWGNTDASAKYIETFYGRRPDVKSQMFIEIMQLGEKVNSYYTYFKYGNVFEKGGRSGGYFALTLRINYYYADVQNMYNLLEAAFNKYMLRTVLNPTGDGYRFLISHFSEADANLKALETEMVHYLMQFSDDSDFVSLNGFNYNPKDEGRKINLLEIIPSVVMDTVRSSGKISISPLYQSLREQDIIQKKDAEINRVKLAAQNEIEAVRQEWKAAIDTEKKNVTKLESDKRQLEVDKSQLKNKLDAEKNEVSKLKNELSNMRQKYEHSINEFAKSFMNDFGNAIVEVFRQSGKGKDKKTPNNGENNGKQQEPEHPNATGNSKAASTIVQKIYLYKDWIIILLLCIILYFSMKS